MNRVLKKEKSVKQQKKKNIWIGELQLIAWKDSVIHTEEKVVHWTTTYDVVVEMANIISKNMIK